MSTTTTRPAVVRADIHPVTMPRVLKSEWIKLRSLRSSKVSVAIAFVLLIGLGAVVAWAESSQWPTMSAADRASFDAANTSMSGYHFAQLAIGVVGVLAVSGEYATGMIRASLTAVPRRLPVLWAKALVFSAIALVTMTVAAFLAFFVGQAVLSGRHLETTLSSPGVLRVVLGTGLYLMVVGLLGVALGALLRNTAGAITTLVGGLFLLPLVTELLPSSWSGDVGKYLPGTAGDALLQVHQQAGMLAPWTGFALMCGYTVVALGAAAWVLKRRDA